MGLFYVSQGNIYETQKEGKILSSPQRDKMEIRKLDIPLWNR